MNAIISIINLSLLIFVISYSKYFNTFTDSRKSISYNNSFEFNLADDTWTLTHLTNSEERLFSTKRSNEIILHRKNTQCKEYIGYLTYKLNGQIGIVDVQPEWRLKGIAKYLITLATIEIKKNNPNIKLWIACSKKHYFWSAQRHYKYYENIHPSVNSTGYRETDIDINDAM